MIQPIDIQTRPTTPAGVVLARRGEGAAGPNHHIWDNNGTWWLHYTLHRPDHTKHRVRESLRTRDLAEARRRRDRRLDELAGKAGPGADRRRIRVADGR